MLADPISAYFSSIELVVQRLERAYVERYEEEAIASDRANLRIRIRFRDGHMLEMNEAVVAVGRRVEHLAYRYHCQDESANLIFRYDNTPHFRDIETFPHHKHLPEGVTAANHPSILGVIEEANEIAA